MAAPEGPFPYIGPGAKSGFVSSWIWLDVEQPASAARIRWRCATTYLMEHKRGYKAAQAHSLCSDLSIPVRGSLPSDLNFLNHLARTLWSKMPSLNMSHVIALTTLLLSSILLRTDAQDTCNSSSQPNPIAQQYADIPTGTFNATLAIIPISLTTARGIIPSQFRILESAYRDLLPNFPPDMYPVLMQAGLDHDIQLAAYNISIQDFQVSTVQPSRGFEC